MVAKREATGRADTLERLRRAFNDALRPPKRMTVSAWADAYRMLTSKSSGEPGPWRNSRTPYVVEIQDCLSWQSDVEAVVWMKASQVGGTEVLLNWIGYTIDQDPCPMMVVEPTLDLAKLLSKQRLDPMLEEADCLRERVMPARTRDSGNTVFGKDFPGGMLRLAGANSAASLRQAPIAKLGLDEVDEYPIDVEGQGDPVELARARTRRFPRRKVFLVSSPTIEGSSRIAQEFDKTDQAYFHVPCPDCGHEQRLVWANLKYEHDEANKRLPETARYCCERCGSLIPEHKKTWMLERGKWVSTYPERRGKMRGFHLSALYSPVGTFSWADCVKAWDNAQGNPELLKTFVNTVLGETSKGTGDAPVWERLYNRREHYREGTVPKGALILTAGVDVQGGGPGNARCEYEIVGWGPRFESWSIERGVVRGPIAAEETKAQLVRALERSFPVIGTKGLRLPLRLVAIDAGFETQEVYKFVRTRSQQLWVAVHGARDNYPLLVGHPMRADVLDNGKTLKRGLRSYPVGTTIAKRQLYGWLKQEQPTHPETTGYPDGWCHFPQYDEEYFKQLCAERAVPKKDKRGFIKWQWEASHRNEMLDCRVYARAAAALLQLDRYSPDDWKKLAAAVAGGGARPPQPAEADDERDEFWGRHG